MKTSSNQRGSSFLVVLLGLVVIVVAGVAGYKVLHTTDTGTISSSTRTNSVDEPDQINSSADVKKASAALDSTNVESGINPDQLDADLNALN